MIGITGLFSDRLLGRNFIDITSHIDPVNLD
jgi:hypothetical protein